MLILIGMMCVGIMWLKGSAEHVGKAPHVACRGAGGKVWIGLNFYGRAFAKGSGEAEDLLGHQYHATVKKQSARVHWHEEYREHVAEYTKAGRAYQAFYPSLQSIQVLLTPPSGEALRDVHADTCSMS